MNEEIIAEAKITKWLFIRDILLMFIYIGFLLIIVDIINAIGMKLYFTNKSVFGKIGILKTQKLNSPLNKINNIETKQEILGKIFNYGTIEINTSSASYEFKYISNPDEFANKLRTQIEKYDDERIRKQAEELAKAMKE
jgi:uncharacterized membrane protein YdbT with pleckstrin-like domain